MDAQQIGESIAKAVSREYKGVDVDFGEVIGRREDGSVSVSVGGGTVAARAMASFDVGAAVGKQVMLVEKDGIVTIMGTMADAENAYDFTDAVNKINEANSAIGQIQDSVDQAEQAADQAAQSAQQAASDASAASEKADQLAQKVSDVEVEVSGFDGRLDELSTSVSGAVSDAGEALSMATEAKQTADGISSTAQRAYENAEEALTQSSTAVQTAQQVQTTVQQDYLKKTDAASTYAAKSDLTQTADAIRAEVEKDFEDADGRYATKAEVEQTADGITQSVEKNYLSKSDAGTTYASKTELTQTADGLQVSITEAAGAASAAQTTANSAQSAAGAAQSTANSAQSAASAAQSAADTAQAGVDEVNTFFVFDQDGLHVGKRATSATGAEYQTAETVMGSNGTFRIYDAGGNVLATVSANGIIFSGGRFGMGYRPENPDRMLIYCDEPGDSIRVFTDEDGQINIYCNDNQPQYHGALMLQRMYAGIFAGDGTSDAAGSGAYVIAGYSSANGGMVTLSADTVGIRDRGNSRQLNIDISQVQDRLGPIQTTTAALGYGYVAVKNPFGIVTISPGTTGTATPIQPNWQTLSLGTLPAGYRPQARVVLPCFANGAAGTVYADITQEGTVSLVNSGTTAFSERAYFTATYIAAQS